MVGYMQLAVIGHTHRVSCPENTNRLGYQIA
jgi:hypothetical protein